MPEYPTVTLKSFSGGQVDRDHPSAIADNQFQLGKNIDTSSGGLFDSRLGRTKKVNTPGSSPQGACWFSVSESNNFFIEVNSGRIFKWEGSAASFTEIDPTVQLNNMTLPVQMYVLNGRLYIHSGNADNVRSWDGSSATLTDEGNTNTDPALTSLCCTQSRKGFAAQTGTAGTDDFIYPSAVNDGQTYDRTASNVRLPTEGNERVTAIAMFRKSQILAFTRNTSHVITVSESSVSNWVRETVSPKIGSVSPWVSVVGSDAFFQSPDGHFRTIKNTDFGESQAVDEPVTVYNPKLIARLNKSKLGNTRGIWFNNILLVSCSIDGSAYNNVIIPFDMLHRIQTESGQIIPACMGEWTNMYVGEFVVTYFNNRHQLYYMDSRDGALYLMFDGDTDDGTPIVPEVRAKSLDFGTQRHDKTLLDGDIQVFDTFGTLTLSYSKDSGPESYSTAKSESIGGSQAQLPFTLPVQLGSGGVTDFVPVSFYGAGQSRFWQPRVTHTGGKISLKQMTIRAKVHNALSRAY